MANTQNYINHLLQNTGITPACSEEERLAAEDIAQIFRNHGFDPEVQEFNAPAPSRLAFAVTGILAFAGALLMGIGGGIGLVGTLLAIVGAVLYVLERTGHPVVSRLGKTGVSQNVIAYHKASGRSRLRATARWSLSHTTTLPVLSCSLASLCFVSCAHRQAVARCHGCPCCRCHLAYPAAPRRAQGSAVDCRDPRFPRCARQRGKHHF